MRNGGSRAKENKRIRQEALRDQLRAGGHIEHVIDTIGKIKELKDGDKFGLEKLKTSADLSLKLVNKYLPDLKTTELTGEDGGPITTKTTFHIIGVEPDIVMEPETDD